MLVFDTTYDGNICVFWFKIQVYKPMVIMYVDRNRYYYRYLPPLVVTKIVHTTTDIIPRIVGMYV